MDPLTESERKAMEDLGVREGYGDYHSSDVLRAYRRGFDDGRAPLRAGGRRRGSGRPKHALIADELRPEVLALKAGQYLQSESEMCARFGVSRATVRQARATLVSEGLAVVEQGLGMIRVVRDGGEW